MKKILIGLLAATLTIVVYLVLQQGIKLWPKEETREEIIARGSCDLPIEKGVHLSDNEICALELIKERCGNLDQCFVNCYTSGEGIDVVGGCAHLCNYGWKIDWQSPEGTDECYGKLGDKT